VSIRTARRTNKVNNLTSHSHTLYCTVPGWHWTAIT